MRKQKRIAAIFLLAVTLAASHAALAQQEQATPQSGEEAEQAELRAAVQYVPAERIERLKAFMRAHPNSALKSRAEELMVSGRAAWGDEKLRAGDAPGALGQFRLAVAEAPASMTDKLYVEVVSKIPFNLFLLGQRAGAMEIARLIEAKVKDDAKRLLLVANFYTRMEEAQDAIRVSEAVVRLAPEMAAAHYALALARHIAFQLDEAATEYARALELDPRMATARRSLADLRRAGGRAEEALALYREQLTSDGTDKQARAGVVLSLFELGKKEEAEREMEAALRDEPRNLALLTGAAYWFAAHGEGARALELAQRAVEAEPRYVWAQVALARALIAARRPLEAEQALRVARRFGRFPTLDYELANALAFAGLYDEAAGELARSFTLRGGQIETRLAGRAPSQNASFIELLAPERRASIFQASAAESESNARMLKALLAFNIALGKPGERESVKEKEAVAAAQEFAAGEDTMRSFRQLYAANRLLRAGVASQAVMDLAEAAAVGIEGAIDAPAASVSLLAEELYSVRAQAIAAGTIFPVTDIERGARGNILRGRIEEIIGWTLYNQDKRVEAVARLRRAVGLLPENSVWWRTALWRLGAALERNGDEQEALASYLRSYDKNAPDAARRSIMEALYRKLNGSLEGFEAKLGASSSQTSSTAQTSASPTPQTSTGETTTPSTTTTTTPAQDASSSQAAAQSASATPTVTVTASPTPEPVATSAAQPTTTTDNRPAATEPTPEVTPTPAPTPARTRRSEGNTQEGGDCAVSIDVSTVTIKNNGGSAVVTIKLTGADKITPTNRDWPDVSVFAQSIKEYGTHTFLITSISKRTGTYTITFTTPCGSKDVTVVVR